MTASDHDYNLLTMRQREHSLDHLHSTAPTLRNPGYGRAYRSGTVRGSQVRTFGVRSRETATVVEAELVGPGGARTRNWKGRGRTLNRLGYDGPETVRGVHGTFRGFVVTHPSYNGGHPPVVPVVPWMMPSRPGLG